MEVNKVELLVVHYSSHNSHMVLILVVIMAIYSFNTDTHIPKRDVYNVGRCNHWNSKEFNNAYKWVYWCDENLKVANNVGWYV